MLTLLAPVLPLQNPDATNLADRLQPPGTSGHVLGTDELGRDLLSRIIWGGRVSIAVGFMSVGIALLF
ncbi:ABC transporter permease, partial [Frankia sp. Cpl3]|nr:ABC transporter permease [Frankia sp. Cpl3]